MARIHIDTDIGGDPDDLCALALALAWPGAEITGITTCTEHGGMRAGMVAHALRLAGRAEAPVAAGSEGSLSGFYMPPDIPDVERYWQEPITPLPSPPGAALDLLARSIEAGAAVVAIGPYTNLALLEIARPGLLARASVVLMGGHVSPLAPGLPPWGPEMDYNVRQDRQAARIVFESCAPLLVQLPITLQVHLRAAHLPRLHAAGPLARLIAHQAECHVTEPFFAGLGRLHAALPDDLLNFHHDPLAVAVALGWDGVRVETLPLVPRDEDGMPAFVVDKGGKPTRVVTEVEAE
jgi:inosine-uridine nucleoside N-ribohydrolase